MDVPALNVRPVVVEKSTGVPKVIVTVDEPSDTVRVLLLLERSWVALTL